MSRKLFTLLLLLVLASAVFWAKLRPGEVGASPGRVSTDDLFPSAFHSVSVDPVAGPNVLLICIDTLRADHMSLHGYFRKTTPQIDAFSTHCRVFDRAYATAPFTAPSVVSMLTGLYPYHHGVRLFWQRVTSNNITLADHLRRAGYQAAAVVSNVVLSDKACGLGARFEYYDDRVDEPEAHRPHMLQRSASRTTDAAVAWLNDKRQPDHPFFLWVHYIDPHGPYRPPPGAPVDFTHDAPEPVDPERILEYVREPGLTDGLEYVDRYDEEIAYTDREVGRLLEAYADLGLADDSLIILTADHGEQLMDSARFYFSHGYTVRDSVVRIPLMIRHPSVPQGRIARPVSIADVMPTVLDVAGLPLPDGLDGRSLAAEISTRPPYAEGRDAHVKGRLMRALVHENRKVVVRHGLSNIARKAWAFDLQADPDERTPLPVDPGEPAYLVLADLIRADPDPAGRPKQYAKGWQPPPLVADTADSDAIVILKSLGYIE